MSEERWPQDEGRQQESPSAGFVVAQVFLAVAALLVFLWLVNILLEHPDQDAAGDPVLSGLAEAMGANAWIATSLVLLAIILLIEILLLRPTMREAVMDVRSWTPAAQPQHVEEEWHDDVIEQPHAPEHLIGCPACGTVFDAAEHGTDTHGSFACPNCGRHGRVRTREPVTAELRDIDCPRCHRAYQAYQDDSHCPRCGQHIKVRERA